MILEGQLKVSEAVMIEEGPGKVLWNTIPCHLQTQLGSKEFFNLFSLQFYTSITSM
jgi:hypothetical protein